MMLKQQQKQAPSEMLSEPKKSNLLFWQGYFFALGIGGSLTGVCYLLYPPVSVHF
jgi:hypothetical protein